MEKYKSLVAQLKAREEGENVADPQKQDTLADLKISRTTLHKK